MGTSLLQKFDRQQSIKVQIITQNRRSNMTIPDRMMVLNQDPESESNQLKIFTDIYSDPRWKGLSSRKTWSHTCLLKSLHESSHKSRIVTLQEHTEQDNRGHVGRYGRGINMKQIMDAFFERIANFKDILKQYCYLKRTVWNQLSVIQPVRLQSQRP